MTILCGWISKEKGVNVAFTIGRRQLGKKFCMLFHFSGGMNKNYLAGGAAFRVATTLSQFSAMRIFADDLSTE
jgi:hypothetical protein